MQTESSVRAEPFVADLQRLFGDRLESVVGFGRGEPAATLVLVASLTPDDLAAMAALANRWHAAGLATPLVLPHEEFSRSLDVFPLEFGEIIETHKLLAGRDPFAGLVVSEADRRRACEVQVRSHLLHLRENYLEGRGAPQAVAELVRESAPAFAGLLELIARLDGRDPAGPNDVSRWAAERIGLDLRVIGDVIALAPPNDAGQIDAARLFPDYLVAMTRLARFVDDWLA